MAAITNPKLESVAPPVWKRYPGISVLYDDPACAGLSGIEPLAPSSRAEHRDQPLYRGLRILAEAVASSTRGNEVGLCLLPSHSYHVTLCDGVNEGTRAHVHPDVRSEVARTLDELPDSLLWPSVPMRVLQDRELAWSVWTHPITFRVEALQVWGHVLVACLEPADERSVAAKATHERARGELAARLHARLGVRTQEWRPHLSLGYFPRQDAAAHAREHVIPRWQDDMRERTEGLSVTFRSASTYGFTDMVTFWRLVQ